MVLPYEHAAEKKLADFNLAVERYTTKFYIGAGNTSVFWLYGN